MNVSAIGTLATTQLGLLGNQVILVLTAVIGIAIAYFLFKFAWNKIKGSVSEGNPSFINRNFGDRGDKYRQTTRSYYDGSYKAKQDF